MPLSQEARPARSKPWVLVHLAGLVSACLGVLGFALTAWLHLGRGHGLMDIPDPILPVLFFVPAAASAIASFVRREGTWFLPVAGASLAASAMIVGVALVLWAIALVTVGIILILSEMM